MADNANRLGDLTRPAMGRREREAHKLWTRRTWDDPEYGCAIGFDRGTLGEALTKIDAEPMPVPVPVPTDFDHLDEMLARGALRPAGRRLHAALILRFKADPEAELSDEDVRQARLALKRACAPMAEWHLKEGASLDEADARFDATYPLPAGFIPRGEG